MRFPWVTREALAIALTARDYEHENAQALRRSLADLTDKYHQLRLSGHEIPEPHATPIKLAEQDALKTLVVQRSGGNRLLMKRMLAQLAEDRLMQVDEDEIARRIIAGVTDEGVPA